MRPRISALWLVGFVLTVVSVVPAAAGSERYSPERYPAPPITFDPASILVGRQDWWGWGPPAVSAADGSRPRSAAPVRSRDSRMLAPGVWLQGPLSTCGDGRLSGWDIMHPGRAAIPIPAWATVSMDSTVADGALWVGRQDPGSTIRRQRPGRGIWRIPLDGGTPTLAWRLRDAELYTIIAVSGDGRRIAAGPYTGQFRTDRAPRPRVRIEGRGEFILPRYLDPVGWDAHGRLILRGERILRWDPSDGSIRPIDRRRDEGWAWVLPGGRTIVVTGRYRQRWSEFGLIDAVTGRRRNVRLIGSDWSLSSTSTAQHVVFEPWYQPFRHGDTRELLAIAQVRDGWVGYVVAPALSSRLLPPVTVVDPDGRPRPPAWFDASAIRYLGSPTGDPDDLSAGLWTAALDGSNLEMVSATALEVVSLDAGGFAWTQPSAVPGPPERTLLVHQSNDGSVRLLADDIAGEVIADPDGTAVWALRYGILGTRTWWRIPVDGGHPRAATQIPADATDLRIHAGGDPIAWTRVRDGKTIHAWWSARHLERSRSAVWTTADPIIGFTCRGVPVHRQGDAIRVVSRSDPPVTVMTTDREVGMPADQNQHRTVIGPVQARHARTQVMTVLGDSWKDSSDGEGYDEPSHSIALSPGRWRRTSLDTDRYVVLHDADRGRLGIFDRIDHWFAEVPFNPQPRDAEAAITRWTPGMEDAASGSASGRRADPRGRSVPGASVRRSPAR